MEEQQYINKHILNKYNEVLKLHNNFHLGDQIFNMIYFNKISQGLKEKNIMVVYSLPKDYIQQVSEFLLTENVILVPLENMIEPSFLFWIGNTELVYNIFHQIHQIQQDNISFNDFYSNFFNLFSIIIKVHIFIETIAYTDTDLLLRYEKLNDRYKNLDILIINSVPLSNQFDYDENEWNNIVNLFNDKYNIVTTKKVPDVKCTLDDHLTIKDIAALSTNVKVIIAVNTGVVPGLLNEYTLNNIKSCYIFDKELHYNFKNFFKYQRLNELPIQEIFETLDKVKMDSIC